MASFAPSQEHGSHSWRVKRVLDCTSRHVTSFESLQHGSSTRCRRHVDVQSYSWTNIINVPSNLQGSACRWRRVLPDHATSDRSECLKWPPCWYRMHLDALCDPTPRLWKTAALIGTSFKMKWCYTFVLARDHCSVRSGISEDEGVLQFECLFADGLPFLLNHWITIILSVTHFHY